MTTLELRQLLHATRPDLFTRRLQRLGHRVARRLLRKDHRVARLRPRGAVQGRVLFSYILDPLLAHKGPPRAHDHTNLWESWRMAQSWLAHGFAVDAISWTDGDFRPSGSYDVLIDVRTNLERLAPVLGEGVVKILHIDTAHHAYHNRAQLALLADLEARRGIVLKPRKLLPETRGIETADRATILGNEFTQATYRFADRPLSRIPISSPLTWPWPEDKNFAAARRRFLWFGSGGLVHKGLHLVLEAFARMPDFELVVCGPVEREADFERAFWKELYQAPNIHTLGWVDIASNRFRRLVDRTVGLIYPTCSEGGGGGVLTCMHAGLIPVTGVTSSVDLDPGYSVTLSGLTVDGVREGVEALACRSPAELEAMARAAWSFARQNHTQEHFGEVYDRFVDQLLDGRRPEP